MVLGPKSSVDTLSSDTSADQSIQLPELLAGLLVALAATTKESLQFKLNYWKFKEEPKVGAEGFVIFIGSDHERKVGYFTDGWRCVRLGVGMSRFPGNRCGSPHHQPNR